jgi:acetyl esterase/lipase
VLQLRVNLRLNGRLGVAIAIAALGLTLSGCGGGTGLVGTHSVLTYCTGTQASGTLDLYEPSPPPTSPQPIVVFLHGGAWELGDGSISADSFDGDLEADVVNKGWAFASVNYRLAPQYKWPAMIEDAKCAVRALRAHAAYLKIDPNRIAAVGASAGGQLASLLGLAGPSAGFDVGQYPDQSSRVEAVVDEYGPTDLNAPSWSVTPLAKEISPAVFGVPSQPVSAVLSQASPVSYVNAAAPPFLVIQGAVDEVVAPEQSEELVQRLHADGAAASLVMVQNAGHGLIPIAGLTITPSIASLAQQTTTFLTQQLLG